MALDNNLAASRLRRLLGLGFALAVGVGGTLGTGVLSSPGELARAVPGGPGLGLALWLVGGFYTLLAANTLAELAGRLPQAGGWYGYAHAAFGEFAAVAVAWADWTSSCVTGALVALLLGADDPAGGALEALGVGHRSAAELHDDGAGHGGGV